MWLWRKKEDVGTWHETVDGQAARSTAEYGSACELDGKSRQRRTAAPDRGPQACYTSKDLCTTTGASETGNRKQIVRQLAPGSYV